MILVDTSVWIDHFRGAASLEARRLGDALLQGEDVCTCGLILSETLRGIGDASAFLRTRRFMTALIYLPMSRKAYLMAADLYRLARKRGRTVRGGVDCLIAACAVAHRASVLHRDRDFDALAALSALQVVHV